MEKSKVKKTTLRLTEKDQTALTSLQAYLCKSTEHAAILEAIHYHEVSETRLAKALMQVSRLQTQLAELKSLVSNVQIAYIDLTLFVLNDENGSQESVF